MEILIPVQMARIVARSFLAQMQNLYQKVLLLSYVVKGSLVSSGIMVEVWLQTPVLPIASQMITVQ